MLRRSVAFARVRVLGPLRMFELFARAALILGAPVVLTLAGFYFDRQPAEGPLAAWSAHGVFYGGAVALAAASASVVYAGIGGMAALRSRAALIALFALGRRLVPLTMAISAAGVGVSAVSAIGWLVTQLHFNGVALWKLGLIAFAIASGAFVGVRALFSTLRAFRAEPMDHMGRAVSPQQAPELWAVVRHLAEEVGAPAPDAIVVGLLGGPFVTACDMRLAPEGRILSGRILYLPMPTLLILDITQLSAVLSHELAHFSGADVEYSLKLAPSYTAMSRGIQTVAGHDAGLVASLAVTGPAISQLVLLTMLFDLAVRRWSREREFRADRIGGEVIGFDFAASALARYAAFDSVVGKAVEAALENPEKAPKDLVADIARAVRAAGAQDPRPHLEQTTPHPTDTHPPIAARITALGQKIDDAFLAGAGMAAPQDHAELLDALFVDPKGLARTLTDDLIGEARAYRDETVAHLERVASAEVVTRAFFETPGFEGRLQNWIGWSVAAAGAAFLACGLAEVQFPLLAKDASWLMRAGGALGALGAFWLWRTRLPRGRLETPFFEIGPNACRFPDAGLILGWDEIAEIRIGLDDGFVAAFRLGPDTPAPDGPLGDRLSYDAGARELTLVATEVVGGARHELANAIIAAHSAARARDLLREERAAA
ncbi:MAG: hypothetical protein CTY15_14605 [Methylocystis sp.]|nr:MAG: hypothetical protein CTY15_14605 [Methylocystis sp.]